MSSLSTTTTITTTTTTTSKIYFTACNCLQIPTRRKALTLSEAVLWDFVCKYHTNLINDAMARDGIAPYFYGYPFSINLNTFTRIAFMYRHIKLSLRMRTWLEEILTFYKQSVPLFTPCDHEITQEDFNTHLGVIQSYFDDIKVDTRRIPQVKSLFYMPKPKSSQVTEFDIKEEEKEEEPPIKRARIDTNSK